MKAATKAKGSARPAQASTAKPLPRAPAQRPAVAGPGGGVLPLEEP